jgi:hypothetical protein
MGTGPSREDLKSYWQNSRQYFDELAKYYQTADPEYYRQNIKPFYDNPFQSVSSSQNRGGGGKLIVVLAVFVLFAVMGAGLLFFLARDNQVTKKFEEVTGTDTIETRELKETQKPEKEKTVDEVTSEETGNEELTDEDNFIIGAKYISEKKYDKAAFHLNRIKPGSKRYKEAQQLIESIKYLKKYDK